MKSYSFQPRNRTVEWLESAGAVLATLVSPQLSVAYSLGSERDKHAGWFDRVSMPIVGLVTGAVLAFTAMGAISYWRAEPATLVQSPNKEVELVQRYDRNGGADATKSLMAAAFDSPGSAAASALTSYGLLRVLREPLPAADYAVHVTPDLSSVTVECTYDLGADRPFGTVALPSGPAESVAIRGDNVTDPALFSTLDVICREAYAKNPIVVSSQGFNVASR